MPLEGQIASHLVKFHRVFREVHGLFRPPHCPLRFKGMFLTVLDSDPNLFVFFNRALNISIAKFLIGISIASGAQLEA